CHKERHELVWRRNCPAALQTEDRRGAVNEAQLIRSEQEILLGWIGCPSRVRKWHAAVLDPFQPSCKAAWIEVSPVERRRSHDAVIDLVDSPEAIAEADDGSGADLHRIHAIRLWLANSDTRSAYALP